jgi:hypothetical protein
MVVFATVPPGAGCDVSQACAVAPRTVYVSSFWDQPGWISQRAEVLDHELGHVFDYTRMSDGARNRFRSIMGITRPWRSDPNSPHEQFAEAFSLCVRSARFPPRAGGGYDYTPTTSQHRSVCRMILHVEQAYQSSEAPVTPTNPSGPSG